MSLKVSWYKFKTVCFNLRMLNVIPKVTTRKIAIEHKQKKMRKEFKQKYQLNTKESSNIENAGQVKLYGTEKKK